MVRNSISTFRAFVFATLLGVAATQATHAFVAHHERPKRVARTTVEAMEEQWRLAQLNGDAVAMDPLLSDDYVGITASGEVTTKAQQLARVRERAIVLSQLDLFDIKVKMLGSTVAVVTSRAELKGTSDGDPLVGEFRYTRVYQRSLNGAWKITSFEATRARPGGNGKPRTEADVSALPHP